MASKGKAEVVVGCGGLAVGVGGAVLVRGFVCMWVWRVCLGEILDKPTLRRENFECGGLAIG